MKSNAKFALKLFAAQVAFGVAWAIFGYFYMIGYFS